MKPLLKAACLIAAGLCLCAPAYAGSQGASAGWGDSWDFHSANDRIADQNGAALQYQLTHGGLGNNVTTNVGTENVSQTYNGPVSDSSSTNMNNVSSSTVHAYDSNVTVTTTQGSQTTEQSAASKNLTNSTDR